LFWVLFNYVLFLVPLWFNAFRICELPFCPCVCEPNPASDIVFVFLGGFTIILGGNSTCKCIIKVGKTLGKKYVLYSKVFKIVFLFHLDCIWSLITSWVHSSFQKDISRTKINSRVHPVNLVLLTFGKAFD